MTGPRVRSGSRTMTLKQAINDERIGGDFIASMSNAEFLFFQKLLLMKIKNLKITPRPLLLVPKC
jgi:hypothetical protein